MLSAQALEIKEKKKIECTWVELDIEGLLVHDGVVRGGEEKLLIYYQH